MAENGAGNGNDDIAGGAPAEGANGAAPAAAQPKLSALGQFVRDLSFENILAQKGVQGDVSPDTQVQVALDAKKRSIANQYEVAIKIKIESKTKASGATLFLLEMDYAGLFTVENVPDEQLHPLLMIECPRLLFPFVRRIVHDVTRDGGFPALNLEQIDFMSIYRQQILQRARAQQAAAPEAGTA